MLTCLLFSNYYHQVNVAGADGECLHSMKWVLYWNVGFLLVPLAHPKLTPLLLSCCCTDTPNQQCRSDFILSKSNMLNVFILGFRRGTWIDCYLDSVGGTSWQHKRCEPIGWHDAVFLAQLYYLDANTKYWRVLSRSHWLWGVGWGEWYMIMLFVCHRMWAILVLTPVLSSRCCADSPNKQGCKCLYSIQVNHIKCIHSGLPSWLLYWLDTLILLVACLDGWFSLFLPILSLLSKSPPEFIVRHLILYEGKYKKE
jgi:hypothetical protein